jgi:hypothetical protein
MQRNVHVIEDAHEGKVEYDEEISSNFSIEEILSSTTEKRDSAPVQKLPPELMTEVFHIYQNLVFPNGRERLSRRSLDSRVEGVMLLTSVCSRWRQIAISIPGLWSRFSIFVGDKGADLSQENMSTGRFVQLVV